MHLSERLNDRTDVRLSETPSCHPGTVPGGTEGTSAVGKVASPATILERQPELTNLSEATVWLSGAGARFLGAGGRHLPGSSVRGP